LSLEILRSAGKRLIKEIPALREEGRAFVAVGASGDRTYKIDKTAEDIILSALRSSGEGFTVISEEIGDYDINGGGTRVLIDPVDGSRNAISGIPFYCSSIALASGDRIGDIETAYVLNLVTGEEFWAEKGKGTFLNGTPVKTRTDDELTVVAYEAQAPSKDIPDLLPLLRASRKTRCLGATALDLAYLAAGSIAVFANPSPSRSFDFGAGWLLVSEAGGVFTDIKGNAIGEIEMSVKRSVSLLASANARLHKKVLGLLKN
jgi:myo-inositol-1(or 4)-monophosphatase